MSPIENCSADWYKGRLTDAELDELENPKPKVTKKSQRPARPAEALSRRKFQPKGAAAATTPAPVDESVESEE